MTSLSNYKIDLSGDESRGGKKKETVLLWSQE